MKITSKTLVFGAIAVVLLAALLLLQPASASPIQQQATTTTTATGQGQGQGQGNGTGTTTANGPKAEVWAQFCVVSEQRSYVLVALPQNANFNVGSQANTGQGTGQQASTTGGSQAQSTQTTVAVSPTVARGSATPSTGGGGNNGNNGNTGAAICNNVGTMDDKQLLLCRGPQLQTITLNITLSGQQNQELVIMPPGCARNFATPGRATPNATGAASTSLPLPTGTIVPASPTP